uniref:VQ domain-containing protein n=1 Tax=Rhizophora mucronata TaxID=61149 RepID=A0A2P2PTY7_RHIMU
MSETMTPSSDWGQFYQQSLSNQVAPLGRTLSGTVFGSDRISEATAVTTTITSATAPTPLGSANSGTSGGGRLSHEGRVCKPPRRRSRASRRTPTTLLNTDTTNFRAMVQQFTGGPSAPYAAGSQLNAANYNLGIGLRQANVNPSIPVMVSPAAAGYHLQYQPQQQQQQQYQHQDQPRPASYMFSLGNSNNNNNSFGPSGNNFFLQRFGNPPRTATTSMEAVSSDGFLMEGVSSQGPAHPPPPSRPFLQ